MEQMSLLLNGVRTAAIATASTTETQDGESTMTISLRHSVETVSDPRSLDASVNEVFQMMLGVACHREETVPTSEMEAVTAVVGFGGVLSGACVFRSSGTAAMKIAGHMTGMDFVEVDDTVKDGIGEICNMLAGAWKGKVPELAANCGLSVPAVITGRDYKLHVQAPEFQLHHIYCFEGVTFEVTIICDGLQ
jgi:chemotaxis protein CheX